MLNCTCCVRQNGGPQERDLLVAWALVGPQAGILHLQYMDRRICGRCALLPRRIDCPGVHPAVLRERDERNLDEARAPASAIPSRLDLDEHNRHCADNYAARHLAHGAMALPHLPLFRRARTGDFEGFGEDLLEHKAAVDVVGPRGAHVALLYGKLHHVLCETACAIGAAQ
eukprot:6175147-Pleurochrysis_carterae.AAC.1